MEPGYAFAVPVPLLALWFSVIVVPEVVEVMTLPPAIVIVPAPVIAVPLPPSLAGVIEVTVPAVPFVAEVNLPCASTVIFALVYAPATTSVSASEMTGVEVPVATSIGAVPETSVTDPAPADPHCVL
jgi:hypothetical protein